MLQGDGGDAGPPAEMRVAALVDTGVQKAHALSNDPVLQADLYHMLGGVYEDLGSYDHADELLGAALAQRKRIFGEDSPEAAKSMTELAKLLGDERRLPEAEKVAEQAVGIDRRRLATDAPETLRVETELAEVRNLRGQYASAEAELNDVVRRERESHGPIADLSEALNDLGIVEANLGHMEAAERANSQAMEIDRRLEGDRHPDIASHLLTLAEIDGRLGRTQQAVGHAREALSIDRGWFAADHPEVASASTMLAQALNDAHRYAEARSLLASSLRVLQRLFPTPASPLAQTLNAFAVADLGAGDLAQAEVFATRAVATYRALYPKGSANTGIALGNQARVALARGDFPKAEAMLREALPLELLAFAADHRRVLSLHVLLGRALLGERRFAEAEANLLPAYASLAAQKDHGAEALGEASTALADLYREVEQPEREQHFRALAAVAAVPA